MDVLFSLKTSNSFCEFFHITPSATMNCSFGSLATSALEKKSEVHYMSSETPVPPNFKSEINFSETYTPYEL